MISHIIYYVVQIAVFADFGEAEAEAERLTCMPHSEAGPTASKRLPYVLHVLEIPELYKRGGEYHRDRGIGD